MADNRELDTDNKMQDTLICSRTYNSTKSCLFKQKMEKNKISKA